MDLLRNLLPFSLAVIVICLTLSGFFGAYLSTDNEVTGVVGGIAAFLITGCLVSPLAVLHGIYTELKSINGKMSGAGIAGVQPTAGQD